MRWGERVLSETRESKKASKEASSQGKARWEGNSKLKARWDGAFKKWMDENGDGEGTELRDRLGEIWVLRAKD
jgi:hypothetical protein